MYYLFDIFSFINLFSALMKLAHGLIGTVKQNNNV